MTDYPAMIALQSLSLPNLLESGTTARREFMEATWRVEGLVTETMLAAIPAAGGTILAGIFATMPPGIPWGAVMVLLLVVCGGSWTIALRCAYRLWRASADCVRATNWLRAHNAELTRRSAGPPPWGFDEEMMA